MATTGRNKVELPDLSELSRTDWAEALNRQVQADGDYIHLDDDHHVLQVGDGDRLLVTFESAHDIRNSAELAQPFGLTMAQLLDVSVITVVCQRPTWFRAASVYSFFDAMTDEGVFDGFEHVMFYGAGLGGYAAAAFSVAAPGADVVVVSPQATLDPRMTEWDPRFTSMRKRSFTDRYGYAPDMVQAARHTLVLYNHDEDLEAMHASLFAQEGVTRFRCKNMGRDIAASLEDLRILDDVVRLGLSGELDLVGFAKLYRRRREYGPYLRNLLTEVEDQDRVKLVAWLAGSVLQRRSMPRMRRALERASQADRKRNAAE